jgi:outer membrane receptor for ferrienterochelin and colicin
VPGPWIESIQVTKGIGSVVNGFDGIAGQVNVELKKPDWTMKNREKLFVNLFSNSMGRTELNANTTRRVSKNWLFTQLIHANTQPLEIDMNHDKFMDLPTGNQINGLQRWQYSDDKGLFIQMGVQGWKDDRNGGQMEVDGTHAQHHPPYTIQLKQDQLEAFGKIGYVYPDKTYKSFGFLVSASTSNLNNLYGETRYQGNQKSLFQQGIYQSIIGSTNLKFRTGYQIRWENLDEKLRRSQLQPVPRQFARMEFIPGAFYELIWTPKPRWMASGGFRVDHHNWFGLWATPRFHLRYAWTEKANLRWSAGLGRRVPNLLAENTSLLASSRSWFLPAPGADKGLYEGFGTAPNQIIGGLQEEKAWNFGMSYTQSWSIGNLPGEFVADAYFTRFLSQTVVDTDLNPNEVWVYNLDGKSFSQAFQVQVDQTLMRRLDIRMAWKFMDVRQTLHRQLLEKPFVSRHRWFVNLGYKTRSKWSFDLTWNWMGSKRLPSTLADPESIRFPERSPAFHMVHLQVSKKLGKKWDIYAGVENLTNSMQHLRIKNATDPWAPGFDASLIWGPVVGRMGYGGLRFLVK